MIFPAAFISALRTACQGTAARKVSMMLRVLPPSGMPGIVPNGRPRIRPTLIAPVLPPIPLGALRSAKSARRAKISAGMAA